MPPDNGILLCEPTVFFFIYLSRSFHKTMYVTEPNIFTYVTEMKIMCGKSKPDKIKREKAGNEITPNKICVLTTSLFAYFMRLSVFRGILIFL